MTTQTALLVDMLNQNTQLSGSIKVLTERLESLTIEVHKNIVVARVAQPGVSPSSGAAG
jgi:hypothetical protein